MNDLVLYYDLHYVNIFANYYLLKSCFVHQKKKGYDNNKKYLNSIVKNLLQVIKIIKDLLTGLKNQIICI